MYQRSRNNGTIAVQRQSACWTFLVLSQFGCAEARILLDEVEKNIMVCGEITALLMSFKFCTFASCMSLKLCHLCDIN